MSDNAKNSEQATENVMLNGLYAYKEGMATVYNEQGEAVPVTILRYEPWVVSQIKTKEVDGYDSIQLANTNSQTKGASKALLGHMKKAGVDAGANVTREIRQEIPAGLSLGAYVSIESLKKGDTVKITSRSKGKGFAGSVKRWNFAGGPAAHGSKFHRRPGSSGNRTWPGRVMPGKKFPGHLGDETVTLKSVTVVDVIPSENVLVIKGPVPGARNSLVKLVRV